MISRRIILAILNWAVGACALFATGCAQFDCCRIDPTGDHLFARGAIPPQLSTPASGPAPFTLAEPPYIAPPPATLTPAPPPALAPPVVVAPPVAVSPPPVGAPLMPPVVAAPTLTTPAGLTTGPLLVPQPGVSLSPNQVVAPVGTEVLMIAGVADDRGSALGRRRVEWMIAPGGVGQFVTPGQPRALDFLDALRGYPRKVNNSFALNTTNTRSQTIDRGTSTSVDDLIIRPGQAWVTVSSPVEGTSFVTAYAPDIAGWDRRQQTGTIYWIDAQWSFPPPAINPVGSRHTFVTSLTRQTDGSPVAGWMVRYEIVGGPEAGFSPEGATFIEILTSEAGQAPAEIFQKQPVAGTNQVSIQVIRPAALAGGPGKQVVVGSGSTLKTWTSSDLAVRTTGPSQASVGAIVTYQIQVSNPGGITARNVVVADAAPPGLSYLNSNPAATAAAGGQVWQIGELGPRESRSIETNYRVEQPGNFNYCANVSAEGGLAAKDCVVTATAAPSLDISVIGPTQAEVGGEVTYNIMVVNRGDSPASGLLVTDHFDQGLEHAIATSPIERDLADLAPGGAQQFAVTFRVTRPGQLCQQVAVVGAGGIRGETRSCLTAIAAASGQPPTTVSPPPIVPPSMVGPPAGVPPTPQPAPRGLGGPLVVKKTGPKQRKLDEVAEFKIEVTNTGNTPLTQVVITDNYESSLDPFEATGGHRETTGALVWTVDSLAPGATVSKQVNCHCIKQAVQACNRVTVTADGGLQVAEQACVEILGKAPDTAPSAAPSTSGKLSVTVADTSDPILVGGETTYQILVTNNDQGPATNVKLSASLSEELLLRSTAGPVRGAATARGVRFPPIAELRAGETLTYELRVRAESAGTGRLKVEVSSDGQKSPLAAEEATQIEPQ